MLKNRKPLKRGKPPRRKKPLARNRKPLARSRLVRKVVRRTKNRGRSRFPKRREAGLVAWIREQVCAVASRAGRGECGSHFLNRRPTEPAHIKTQGSGGYDRDNVVPLCPKHHDEQEGCTREFEAKYNVNLRALAVGYSQQYDKQVALGWIPDWSAP